MNITLRGDKIKITDAMQEYANEKLERLDKYLDNSENVNANLVVKVQNYKQKVEVTIPLKNFILRAEEVQDDFYAAVDTVVDKIERQIRKNKTKLQSKKVRDSKEIVFDYIEDYKEIDDDESIVKRKKIEVKPMSEEEAIIQMELLGHQFYLFKDADTMKPSLVYKRNDGQYGIIETE
ncbi:MAG: ribosome-associated translation inhibitor RaiA [Bacilli bacterium]|nr:ribosome-associated translation inhibitor RaiA [Bacilli bacterium]